MRAEKKMFSYIQEHNIKKKYSYNWDTAINNIRK